MYKKYRMLSATTSDSDEMTDTEFYDQTDSDEDDSDTTPWVCGVSRTAIQCDCTDDDDVCDDCYYNGRVDDMFENSKTIMIHDHFLLDFSHCKTDSWSLHEKIHTGLYDGDLYKLPRYNPYALMDPASLEYALSPMLLYPFQVRRYIFMSMLPLFVTRGIAVFRMFEDVFRTMVDTAPVLHFATGDVLAHITQTYRGCLMFHAPVGTPMHRMAAEGCDPSDMRCILAYASQ